MKSDDVRPFASLPPALAPRACVIRAWAASLTSPLPLRAPLTDVPQVRTMPGPDKDKWESNADPALVRDHPPKKAD